MTQDKRESEFDLGDNPNELPLALIADCYKRIAAATEERLKVQHQMDDIEANAKLDLGDDYLTARNNEVREALLHAKLSGHEEYWEHRKKLRSLDAQLAKREIETRMIRALISAHAANAAREQRP